MKEDSSDNIIHNYTDADALADGVLIDISSFNLIYRDLPVNRITMSLYIDLLVFIPGKIESEKMERLRSTIDIKLQHATYKGRISEVPPDLWLVLNEVEGWTLMFPEDY